MANPEISVIIPFYNVGRFVPYCMNSLLAQTFEDFELLCVDDGSTDDTPAILDAYARQDARVRVIHKRHGGLQAAARNEAIPLTRGKYLAFVDGDDFVGPYYLQSMLDAMDGAVDTMVCMPYLLVDEKEILSGRSIYSRPDDWTMPQVASRPAREEFAELLARDVVTESCWGKLMPRAAFGQGFFPAGRLYEDLAAIGKSTVWAERYVLLDEPAYGYVMRGGSTVHKKRVAEKQVDDYLFAIEEFRRLVGPLLDENSKGLVYREALALSRLHTLVHDGETDASLRERVDARVHDYLQRHLDDIMRDPHASAMSKVRFRLLRDNPGLYDAVYHAAKRKAR